MSVGRPSAITPFASAETVYPAGGQTWSGTPIRVKPPTDYVVPLNGVGAQYFNYEVGVLGDFSAAILSYIGNIPVSNFPYRQSPNNDMRAICFDPIYSQWAMAVSTSGTGTQVYTSQDGSSFSLNGSTFTLGGASGIGGDATLQPTAMSGYDSAVQNSNAGFGAIAVAMASPTNNFAQVNIWNHSTGSWAAGVNRSGAGLAYGSVTAFNGLFYCFGGGGTTTKTMVDNCTLGGSGGTANANILGSVTCSKWVSAKNGATESICVGIPSTTTTNTYVTIDTTGTATVRVGAWSTGELPVALAWSDVDQMFMMVTSATPGSGASVSTKVYTSPNGVAWTLVSTMTSTAAQMSSLASMGSLWVAVHENVSGGPGDTVLYSTDKGVTWHAPYIQPLGTYSGAALNAALPPFYTPVAVNADLSQILVANRGGLMGSLNVGAAGRLLT